MKSKYKKVELSSPEEFKIFINKHKKIKYLDVILGDLSGIIRGKRIPISDADKIFKSGVQFCYSTFLWTIRKSYPSYFLSWILKYTE